MCYAMLVQHFDPQGRRFTNFHYCCYYTGLREGGKERWGYREGKGWGGVEIETEGEKGGSGWRWRERREVEREREREQR